MLWFIMLHGKQTHPRRRKREKKERPALVRDWFYHAARQTNTHTHTRGREKRRRDLLWFTKMHGKPPHYNNKKIRPRGRTKGPEGAPS